ncbi:MAG: hypothetical protein ACO3XL_02350, partial [Gemmobacter sp.]
AVMAPIIGAVMIGAGVPAALAARVHHHGDAGDVVLVMGSKGSRVSAVAEALARLGEARAADGPTGGE